jgi:regulatory protein
MKKNALSEQSDNPPGYEEALQRAASLCSRRELSTGQLKEKLREWQVNETWEKRIINYLKEQKFLDDRRYAMLYVKDKFNLNRWGKVKISHMMRQIGLDDELIREALGQIDEAVYYQACLDLIRSKSASLKEKNRFIRKNKLFRYASGRGYESGLIYSILNREDER